MRRRNIHPVRGVRRWVFFSLSLLKSPKTVNEIPPKNDTHRVTRRSLQEAIFCERWN